MALYGFLFWVSEFFRRSFGWDISDAGMVFVTQPVLLGTAGTYAGGWFCDWLTARGYKDAALRSLAAFFAIAMPLMAVTPLMPTAELAILMLGIAVFTLSLQQALSPVACRLSPVATQFFMPNQMRAQVVTVFFVISVFSAIAFGGDVGGRCHRLRVPTSLDGRRPQVLLAQYAFQDLAARFARNVVHEHHALRLFEAGLPAFAIVKHVLLGQRVG